jgi:hypothetical protein
MIRANLKNDRLAFAWIIIAGILILLHFNRTLNNDEGLVLEGALNIFNHKEIYKDFFEFTTPGIFYLFAWAWQIFGISYWVAKALTILAIIASLIGVYQISQNISKKSTNILGPLLLILNSATWPIVMYHSFNLVFMIWATFFILKGLDNQKNKYFIVGGLFTALSILFMQSKGILLMGILDSFLLILAIKNKAYWPKLILYSSSSLIPIALLFIKWSPIFLYKHLIIFPLKNYPGLPNLSYTLLIIFMLWSLIIGIILIKEKNKKIYLLVYAQIILLLSNLPLPDMFHLGLTLFPSYALLGLSISKIKKKSFYHKIIFGTLISIGMLYNVGPAIAWTKYVRPLVDEKKNNVILKYIADNCHQSPYIYAGPFLATIYVNSDFKNPTSFAWLVTDQHTPEQFLLASQQLAQNQPQCAVLDYEGAKALGYNLDNPLDNYLRNNYHEIKKFTNILIYQKN